MHAEFTMYLNRCSGAVLVLAQFAIFYWCMGLARDGSHIRFISRDEPSWHIGHRQTNAQEMDPYYMGKSSEQSLVASESEPICGCECISAR
jgi:hypothetical protein